MRFNEHGEIARNVRGSAMDVAWLFEDARICQAPLDAARDTWQMVTMDTSGLTPLPDWPGGCNAIAAANGLWMRRLDGAPPPLDGNAPWVPSDGRVGDLHAVGAAVLSSERDTCTVTPSGGGTTTFPISLFGELRVWDDHGQPAIAYVSDPGPTLHLRDRFGKVIAADTHPGAYWPNAYREADGTVWVSYYTDAHGLLLHPANDKSRGYQMGQPFAVYNPDMILRADGQFLIGWSLDAGEFTQDSRSFTLGHGMQPLAPIVEPPAPPPLPPETPMTPNHVDTIQSVYAEGGFDLTTHAGCGLFTEACARALHQRDPRWGHLLKYPGQNQFRGHAVDAVLYRHEGEGNGVAVDIISSNATPEAAPNWTPDIPRYGSSDWQAPEAVPVSRITRPSMPFLIAATCFDVGVSRDFGLVDELRAAGIDVLRIVVASTHRTYRTLEEGRAQLRALLPKLIERGMYASVVVNCDTANYDLTEDNVWIHTELVNDILLAYPQAVALVELFNENSHGVEVKALATDPYFLRELDALIDAQFPVAWGANHGGEAISDRLAGGSVICYHSDRSLSSRDNAAIMAAAQRRFGKPVVNMEPKGMDEQPRGEARTDDPLVIKHQAVSDKNEKLGGSCYHFEAGLTATLAVPPYGPRQMHALSLFGAVLAGETPTPPLPPTGDPILDAPLTPAYPVGYDFFVNNFEAIMDEAKAWYYRAFARWPASSDVAHGLWRALNEGERWKTLRGAFEETWPGGGR